MPALGDKSLVHTYDGQHRRVTRTIREWTVSGWDETETTHFIYDGWNVIEEYDITTSNSVLVRNLTWGQDLGGAASLQGAGGVGGLLMVEEITGTTTTAYHFHYDGNGNVTEVTDLNGNPAATYRYDAFGNTLISTGSYANDNRYRFSTKPLDAEVTNAPLYYYAYRYYDPATGRWPSRDPIEERGGLNLYGFVSNSPVGSTDELGRSQLPPGLGRFYLFQGGVGLVVGGGDMFFKRMACNRLFERIANDPNARCGDGTTISASLMTDRLAGIALGPIINAINNRHVIMVTTFWLNDCCECEWESKWEFANQQGRGGGVNV